MFLLDTEKQMVPVVQTLYRAIHRIIHYPVDTFYGRQSRYLLDKIYPLNIAIRLFNSWGLVIISGQVVRIWNRKFCPNLRVERSDNRNMAEFTGYCMNAYFV